MSDQPMTNYTPAQADRIVRSMTVERTKIAELEAERERLTDLVRYARHYLHDEDVIDDDEFAALVADSENGQRVARLAGYDRVQKQLATREKENAELRAQVARLSGPVSDDEALALLGEDRYDMRPTLDALVASRTAPAKERP